MAHPPTYRNKAEGLPALEAALAVGAPQADQCSAAASLGRLLPGIEDEVILNNLLLRSMDLFAHGSCSPLVRTSLLWAFERLGRERIARITNAQLFAGRCLLVVGSSDPATCIAGLKLVAIFVPLVAENMDIHCKVLDRFDSYHLPEAEAAACASAALAALSPSFARAALPRVVAAAGGFGTPPKLRFAAIRCLSMMHHSPALAEEAQDAGKKLLAGEAPLGIPLSPVVASVLKALTILAAQALVTCQRQSRLLQAYAAAYPTIALRCAARLVPAASACGAAAVAPLLAAASVHLAASDAGTAVLAAEVVRSSASLGALRLDPPLLEVHQNFKGGKGYTSIHLDLLNELCLHQDPVVACAATESILLCALEELEACGPQALPASPPSSHSCGWDSLANAVILASEMLSASISLPTASCLSLRSALLSVLQAAGGGELVLNAAEVLAPAVVSRDRDEELFDLLAAVCLTGPGVSGLADVIESAMGQLLRGGQPHLAARLLPAVTAARRSPASAGRSGDPDILLGAYFKEVSEAQLASGDHWGAYQVNRLALEEGLFASAPAVLRSMSLICSAEAASSWMRVVAALGEAEKVWGGVGGRGAGEVASAASLAVGLMREASSALIAISSISAEDLRFQQRFLDLRIRSLKAAVGLVSAVHGDASLLGVPVKEFEALAKEWHAISLGLCISDLGSTIVLCCHCIAVGVLAMEAKVALRKGRSHEEVPSLRLLLADQIAKLEEWAEEEEASSNGGGAGRTAVKGLASRVMSFAGAAEAQRSCAPKGLCSESYSCSLEGQVFRFASLRFPVPSAFLRPVELPYVKVDPLQEAYQEIVAGGALRVCISGSLMPESTALKQQGNRGLVKRDSLLLHPELCPTSAADGGDSLDEAWPPRPWDTSSAEVTSELDDGGRFSAEVHMMINDNFDPGLYRLRLATALKRRGIVWVLPFASVALTVQVQK